MFFTPYFERRPSSRLRSPIGQFQYTCFSSAALRNGGWWLTTMTCGDAFCAAASSFSIQAHCVSVSFFRNESRGLPLSPRCGKISASELISTKEANAVRNEWKSSPNVER